jgi:hypothetical protein
MADEIISTMVANSREHGLLPARVDGRDPCPNARQIREARLAGRETPFGACAASMTTPGWIYSDSTRREYVFLRRAGLEETNDRTKLSARINFIVDLLHIGRRN